MDKFYLKVGAGLIGAAVLAITGHAVDTKITATNEKQRREHERYIMAHPEEYQTCLEVERFERMKSDRDIFAGRCEAYKTEIKGLKESVNYHKNKRTESERKAEIDIQRITSERDEALGRLRAYIERDLNDIQAKCGVLDPTLSRIMNEVEAKNGQGLTITINK